VFGSGKPDNRLLRTGLCGQAIGKALDEGFLVSRDPKRTIRGDRFVGPILIFRTKRSWILSRIGPERRREAEMLTDLSVYSLIHLIR
jgi:hypothetical protein